MARKSNTKILTMKPSDDLTIYEIEPSRVRVFIGRPREKEAFNASVENTRKFGQIMPGKVRDITHLPEEERQREGGGVYDFDLIFGQGRLERAQRLGKKFKTVIVKESEVDSMVDFTTENFNRAPMPPLQLARLINRKMEKGMTVAQVAEAQDMKPKYVKKLLSIVHRTAPGLETDVDTMTVNDAQAFTSLPPAHQKIVMQVFRETKPADIREVIKEAKAATSEDGELSALDIRKSIQGKDTELRAVKERLKPLLLHHELGPVNLLLLNGDQRFMAAMKAEELSMDKFLAICGPETVAYYKERAKEAAKQKKNK